MQDEIEELLTSKNKKFVSSWSSACRKCDNVKASFPCHSCVALGKAWFMTLTSVCLNSIRSDFCFNINLK